jgi:hypothetical protein
MWLAERPAENARLCHAGDERCTLCRRFLLSFDCGEVPACGVGFSYLYRAAVPAGCSRAHKLFLPIVVGHPRYTPPLVLSARLKNLLSSNVTSLVPVRPTLLSQCIRSPIFLSPFSLLLGECPRLSPTGLLQSLLYSYGHMLT